MPFFEIGLSVAAIAAVVVAFWLDGPRGAAITAAVFGLLWAVERIGAAYDAEAEVKRLTAAAQQSEAAFRQFRADSNRAALAAANKIAELRVASALAEAELDSARRRAAEETETLKERIATYVPARPQCDYPQPVLDGLRDAWTAADGREGGPRAR